MERNAGAAAGQREMDVLRKYFPQCFSADGEFDIEAFKAALPGGTTLTDETSGFNWLGKNYARMLTNMDTTTLIRPDEEHNAKPENRNSKNVYISGDNLDAMQHLVKSYGGKVKVIYISTLHTTQERMDLCITTNSILPLMSWHCVWKSLPNVLPASLT